MIDRPVLKAYYHVEVVPSEGVFLLSERGHAVLQGDLYCRLAPLLDGNNTVAEVVNGLAEVASPAEVLYALGRLERQGFLAEATAQVDPARAAFWQALGDDPAEAERRLRTTRITLTGVGAVNTEPLSKALSELGAPIAAPGEFGVVLTDDYLRAELDELNASALAADRPWLLVKPVGTTIWIGPLFRPGHGACWECLAQRLRANREVERYIEGRLGRPTLFGPSLPALPASTQAAVQLAALEVARGVVAGQWRSSDDSLLTFDLLALATERHTVVRRPQCPRCGQSDRQPGRPPRPPQLCPAVQPSGPRSASEDAASATLERFSHHISPLTGIVTDLTPVPAADDRFGFVYYAGHSQDGLRDNLFLLQRWLRTNSSGKGVTDSEARASGLGEALERYSGRYDGDEIYRRGSFQQLGPAAIHPNASMLYSEAQYRDRAVWNGRGSRFNRVPELLDDTIELDWAPVWSLTEQRFKYLPAELVYYGFPRVGSHRFCIADSNGVAAGTTLSDAIVRGFLELVERDAVCLWWYNRLRRPGLDLDQVDDPYVQELRRAYRECRREVWALDLTTDLGLPVVAAVSRRVDGPAERIIFGSAADFDPISALRRALTELNQSAVGAASLGETAPGPADDPDHWRWWNGATVANQPYLEPTEAASPVCPAGAHGRPESEQEALECCLAIVTQQGLDLLVLDQTRPDVGLPVARVIVPGLRSQYARLAPGRLYDVPVALGWLAQPVPEDQLNPIPMFV